MKLGILFYFVGVLFVSIASIFFFAPVQLALLAFVASLGPLGLGFLLGGLLLAALVCFIAAWVSMEHYPSKTFKHPDAEIIEDQAPSLVKEKNMATQKNQALIKILKSEEEQEKNEEYPLKEAGVEEGV